MDSKGTKKRIGFKYAFLGIKYVFSQERNFRIHLLAFVGIIIVGFIAKVSLLEWALLFTVSGIVLVAEMMNSAIELMVDYMKPDIHPTAKAIKDIAAGAVLIAAMTAIIVGCIIFIPKIVGYF